MPGGIFHEGMTSSEARTALYSAVEGKTPSEIEKLKSEYARVLPAILDREQKLAEKGWAID